MPTYAPRRVYLGDGYNGHLLDPGDYASDSAGIQAALNDGHRWLVFRQPDVPFCSTVSLDSLPSGTRFLRLEGARVRSTNFSKAGSGTSGCSGGFSPIDAPLLQALNDEWVLEFRGITFVGSSTEQTPSSCGSTSYSPLMVINRIRDSRFEECGWINNLGRGLYIGATSATRVLFEGCEIGHNCDEGVVVANASRVDFVRCEISRNGVRSQSTLPDLLMSGTSGAAIKGACSIRDNHFESDYLNTHSCIKLHDICAVDIERNYVALAGMTLTNTTSRCRVARNKLIKASTGDPTGINDSGSNDVKTTGIERNLRYV